MLLFYRKLWQDGLPPPAALRAAQLELYRHPRKISELTAGRGLDFPEDVAEDTAHPRLWASFVLSGAGREDLARLVKEMDQDRKGLNDRLPSR
jgi:CHAT domain-containing protein